MAHTREGLTADNLETSNVVQDLFTIAKIATQVLLTQAEETKEVNEALVKALTHLRTVKGNPHVAKAIQYITPLVESTTQNAEGAIAASMTIREKVTQAAADLVRVCPGPKGPILPEVIPIDTLYLFGAYETDKAVLRKMLVAGRASGNILGVDEYVAKLPATKPAIVADRSGVLASRKFIRLFSKHLAGVTEHTMGDGPRQINAASVDTEQRGILTLPLSNTQSNSGPQLVPRVVDEEETLNDIVTGEDVNMSESTEDTIGVKIIDKTGTSMSIVAPERHKATAGKAHNYKFFLCRNRYPTVAAHLRALIANENALERDSASDDDTPLPRKKRKLSAPADAEDQPSNHIGPQ